MKSWNESMSFYGVQNMIGTLKKYEFKTKTREMTFFLSAHDISFWKDSFNPSSDYIMFLEPTEIEIQPESRSKKLVPKVTYSKFDFEWLEVHSSDFIM